MTGTIIAQCQDCKADRYNEVENKEPVTCEACSWVDEIVAMQREEGNNGS